MANVHEQALMDGIGNAMHDGKYSDLTFQCDGRQWKVHKVILCAASPVIKKELDLPMREGQSNVIIHEEFDADTVDRMLMYIYKRTYTLPEHQTPAVVEKLMEVGKPTEKDESNQDDEPTVNDEPSQNDKPDQNHKSTQSIPDNINNLLCDHVAVWGIANYYQIPTLKQYAIERFTALTKLGMKIDDFIQVVKAVAAITTTTNEDLRDCLSIYMNKHLVALTEDDRFHHELATLAGLQDFIVKLLQRFVREQLDVDVIQSSLNEAIRVGHVARQEADQLKIRLAHEQATSHGWTIALRSLPTRCPNANCNRVYGDFANLVFERKASQYGPATGGWTIRCRCRCKLVV